MKLPPQMHPGRQTPGKKKGASLKGRRGLDSHQKSPASNDAIAEASQDARILRKAMEMMDRVPDVREDKVEALKKKVARGEYKVDAAKVADALIEEHKVTDFGKNKL